MFKGKRILYLLVFFLIIGVFVFLNYRRNIIEVKVVEVKRGEY